MFSGKTEELIRRLRRASIARQKVQVFKPRIDDRYHFGDVVAHDGESFPGTPIDAPAEMLALVAEDTAVVGIDEVQFFDPSVVDVVEQLAARGVRVICAGLDQDFAGQPFDPVPQLMAVAEVVTKALAVCMVCGAPANRTQRLTVVTGRIAVGGAQEYEARCRRCHVMPAVKPLPP
jgi:thymidine kinase